MKRFICTRLRHGRQGLGIFFVNDNPLLRFSVVVFQQRFVDSTLVYLATAE